MEYFERRQLKLSDFDIICRFCMQVDLFLKPLFSEDDDGESDDFASEDGSSETVTEMVARCTQLEIRPDDNLPKFMCNFCLEELLRCNKFRRKCLLSDETLKYILETQNPEDESAETNSGGEDRISSLDNIYDVDKIYNLKDDELTQINQRSEELFNWSSRLSSQPDEKSDSPNLNGNFSSDGLRTSAAINCQSQTARRKSECVFCKKTFTGPNSLRRHIARHKGRRKSRKRNTTRIINTPTKSVNQEQGPSSSDKAVQRLYNPIKQYRCSQCSKRFRTFKCLANHERVHVRENQPLKCWLCDSIFLLPAVYRSHMKSHKLSGMKFRLKNSLKIS
ncbi:unnamed protein product [Hermetia illucens]|uniref:Uncharacterized protein n=1 Tax=Hermetia illucens TaxID=343691 RepID=A0A7R8YXA4_HERIL|nr:zinc finger protein 14-like [Hermetia illucens]CAD7088235.1 unnamed protein product [Hermetia illucens]